MRQFSNPFPVGTSVGGTSYFIGRSDIIQKVTDVLRRPLEHGLVLFGQRRIGKSSILRELERKLPALGPWSPIFFDLQQYSKATLEEILDELAAKISDALDLPDPELGPNIVATFRKSWLPTILLARPENARLVLLFDEFDVLADPKANTANRRLFEFLRSIFDDNMLRGRIAAVYAMGRTMDDLDISTGPLFRGIRSEPISTFSRADFDTLLARAHSEGGMTWGTGVIDAIWKLTAGHPMMTQLIASQAWERAMRSQTHRIEVQLIAEIEQSVLRESHNILNWLWGGLTPACRVVVSSFAEHGSQSMTHQELELLLNQSGVRIMQGQLAEAPKRLCEWDVLDEMPTTPPRYRFKVELLRRWVRQHKPFAKERQHIDELNPEAADDFKRAVNDWNTCKHTTEDINRIISRLNLVLDNVGGNPNHAGATDLLAQMYDAQGDINKALQVIERLLPLQTAALRPRYVQLLLTKSERLADKQEHEGDRQQTLEKLLEVAPGTQEALAGLRSIWRAQGERAHAEGRLTDARALYAKAEETALIQRIDDKLQLIEATRIWTQLGQYGDAERFDEAFQLLSQHQKLLRARIGPAVDDLPQKLERSRTALAHYVSGCEAAEQGNKQVALNHFGHVLVIAPQYKQIEEKLARLVAPRPSRVFQVLVPLAGAFAGMLVMLPLIPQEKATPNPQQPPPELPAAPQPTGTRAPAPTSPPAGTSDTGTPAEPATSLPAALTTTATFAGGAQTSGAPPPNTPKDPTPTKPKTGETKVVRPPTKTDPPPTPPKPKRSMTEVAKDFSAKIGKFCPAKFTEPYSQITVKFTVNDDGVVTDVELTYSDDRLSDSKCITDNKARIKGSISFAEANPIDRIFSANYTVKPKS